MMWIRTLALPIVRQCTTRTYSFVASKDGDAQCIPRVRLLAPSLATSKETVTVILGQETLGGLGGASW